MTKLKLGVIIVGFILLGLLPTYASWIDEPYYVSLFARIMIFAIAAVSLDLILGYGGMISFGHAAYLGTGAYAVAVMSFYEIDNGWLQLALAIIGSGFLALIIGAICLRTSGIYFIMITLAFTQMLYFLGISLEEYGGDDGINTNRSEFFEWFDLGDDVNLYYLILLFLILSVFIGYRIINSRFGMVIRGSHSNDQRMQAIGFPTFRYKLAGFVVSGAMCGVAGFLLANQNEFLTPEYMNWFRSGEIMIMVLMGGMGTLFGPVFGTAAFILLEEWSPEILEHISEGWGANWWVVFGPVLIVLVLYAKKGLWGLIPDRSRDDG